MLLIKYLSIDIYRNSPFPPIPQCTYIFTSKITFELSIQVGLLPLLGKSPSADSVGTFHPSSVSYTPLNLLHMYSHDERRFKLTAKEQSVGEEMYIF